MIKYLQIITVLLFATYFCISCSNKYNERTDESKTNIDIKQTEIKFEISAASFEKNNFPNGRIPWINIEYPEIDILIDKDKQVLNVNEAYLIIDYPLTNSVEIKINSKNNNGFTRKDLIAIISEKYHEIYEIEEQTAKTKTIPLKDRKELLNRNTTDGKYDIWGHDLSDLDLSSIEIKKENSKIYLLLSIES